MSFCGVHQMIIISCALGFVILLLLVLHYHDFIFHLPFMDSMLLLMLIQLSSIYIFVSKHWCIHSYDHQSETSATMCSLHGYTGPDSDLFGNGLLHGRSRRKHTTAYMYPSSSSSSPQKPMGPSPSSLTRYGSAPGSLLTSAVDSVIGAVAEGEFRPQPPASFIGRYFSSGDGDSSSLTSESTFKVNSSKETTKPLLRSYGLGEMAAAAIGSSSSSSTTSCSSSAALVRQRSSPAGFLSHHLTDSNGGFSVTRGTGSYNSQGGPNGGHGVTRLKSQLSFTRQDSLSQISEVSENAVEGCSTNGHHNAMHSYPATNFGMDSWDNTNSIVFSAPPSKRAKNMDGDIFNCLNTLESQFSLPQTTLEMATVEKLLHIPEDSVPCKIRAKRGCATHPRSIAERERRTRISGKLKKLQDLVPNMDKQTSYADMLDLAVQHIKGLQNQVQSLHKDLEGCTCGCKEPPT